MVSNVLPLDSAGVIRRNWRLGLRLVFALFWLADAVLKWRLILDNVDYSDVIVRGAAGQPGWLMCWINYWASIAKQTPGFPYLIATVETIIALFLLAGLLTNWVSLSGIIISFLVWSTAEAFGGIFVAGATDIGASPLYMAMFAGLIVVQAGRDRGLDAILSKRYPRIPLI
jgi:uncharacterized membrane protein YphA (DoxX/SURF4 family)